MFMMISFLYAFVFILIRWKENLANSFPNEMNKTELCDVSETALTACLPADGPFDQFNKHEFNYNVKSQWSAVLWKKKTTTMRWLYFQYARREINMNQKHTNNILSY